MTKGKDTVTAAQIQTYYNKNKPASLSPRSATSTWC